MSNQSFCLHAQVLITPEEELKDQVVSIQDGQIQSIQALSEMPAGFQPDYEGQYQASIEFTAIHVHAKEAIKLFIDRIIQGV